MFSVLTKAYLDGRETEDGGDVEADVDADVAGHGEDGVGRAGLDPDVSFPALGWIMYLHVISKKNLILPFFPQPLLSL